MKLRQEQLPASLAGGPAPIYLVSGDEPLLVDESVAALRAAATNGAQRERHAFIVERGFDWPMVSGLIGNLSLFSDGKLLELRLPTAAPGDEGARYIRSLADRGADGNVVVLITPKLDRRGADSSWVRAVTEKGAWVETRPPERRDLPRWITRRLGAAGLAADEEAIELLAARIEGNLLAAQQEIDKLALLHAPGSTLSVADVRDAVADGARFDIFQLSDAAVSGDLVRANRVLAGLRDEGVAPPLVLWALVREALTLVDAGARVASGLPPGQALAAAGVRQWRAEPYMKVLKARRPGMLPRLLKMARRADEVVKGARPGDPWIALVELTCAIAGRPTFAAALN